MSRSSYTACLFIGGPHDGKREMVADDTDIVKIAAAVPSRDFIFRGVLEPLAVEPVEKHDSVIVDYYRHPISAEGLRRSIDVFTNQKEANTGWVLQQLVAGYNPQKPGEDY